MFSSEIAITLKWMDLTTLRLHTSRPALNDGTKKPVVLADDRLFNICGNYSSSGLAWIGVAGNAGSSATFSI